MSVHLGKKCLILIDWKFISSLLNWKFISIWMKIQLFSSLKLSSIFLNHPYHVPKRPNQHFDTSPSLPLPPFLALISCKFSFIVFFLVLIVILLLLRTFGNVQDFSLWSFLHGCWEMDMYICNWNLFSFLFGWNIVPFKIKSVLVWFEIGENLSVRRGFIQVGSLVSV